MTKHKNNHTKPNHAPLRNWLCEEWGEEFIVTARTRSEAEKAAAMYGGKFVREITDRSKGSSQTETLAGLGNE